MTKLKIICIIILTKSYTIVDKLLTRILCNCTLMTTITTKIKIRLHKIHVGN